MAAIQVRCLADAERIVRHGGPRRILFVRAESVSKARAILSVLRAKDLLRKQYGGGGGHVFVDNDEIHYADEGSDGSHGGGADDGWRGWVAEDQTDPDLRVVLEQIVSDDVGSGHQGGGANDSHHDDVVAHGWDLMNAYPFFRAVDLGIILEEVAAYVIPLLVRNPSDPAALRRPPPPPHPREGYSPHRQAAPVPDGPGPSHVGQLSSECRGGGAAPRIRGRRLDGVPL